MMCGVGTINWSGMESFICWSFINKLDPFQVRISKPLFTPRNRSSAPHTKSLVTDTNHKTQDVGWPQHLKQPATKARWEPTRSWFYSPPFTSYKLSINILSPKHIEILSPFTFISTFTFPVKNHHFFCHGWLKKPLTGHPTSIFAFLKFILYTALRLSPSKSKSNTKL